MPPGTMADAHSQHLQAEGEGVSCRLRAVRREGLAPLRGRATCHSVLHCVHFMWLQPALFCVDTLQPGHGLVKDLMAFSVSLSDSKLSRAHWEQLLPVWLSP